MIYSVVDAYPRGSEMVLMKPFMNGRSQALRVPKEFRFEDEEELCMKKIGDVLMVMPKSKVFEIFTQAIHNYPEDALPVRDVTEQQQRESFF